MKKLAICTWMVLLAMLMGCQQNDELTVAPDAPVTGGKLISVTANLQGGSPSRVALTPDTDDNGQDMIKVEWKESGEKIHLIPIDPTSNEVQPIEFTQVKGTNRFTGVVDENFTGTYDAVYGQKNLSVQNGSLAQEHCVYMEAKDLADLTQPIQFQHRTAILKTTFKVGGIAMDARTIEEIVMDGVKKSDGQMDTEGIKVTPDALTDIYLFLPAYGEGYTEGHTLSFSVSTRDAYYEGSLTIPTGKSVEAGKFYTADITLIKTFPYITFSAAVAQNFKMMVANHEALGDKFEYSVGGAAWETLTADEPIEFGGKGNNLRLRGTSSKGTAESTGRFYYIEFASEDIKVACKGDIRTLVDWENYSTADTEEAKFTSLFRNCKALTTPPKLPSTDLVENCYSNMFYGCTSLETAPELPATTLANYCYSYMFYGCTSLKTAPALPATDLTAGCYSNMFNGCTSLNTPPVLSATSLEKNCYLYMFKGCTSLKTAPVLSATNLAESCYNYMFYGCTSLETAPALPATDLAKSCYSSMFNGCTSLETAPVLPATTLAESCYYYMFNGCTSLETPPALSATNLDGYCYRYMFQDCTSLKTAPVLPAERLHEFCYEGMFMGCPNINSITMLAYNFANSEGCFNYWLVGASETGTITTTALLSQEDANFMKPNIPDGWTIVVKQ